MIQKNSGGFSLLEVLIVIPIVVIIITAISSLVKVSEKEARRLEVIALAVAIETQIVSELQNPLFLRPFRINLKNNSALENIEIKYKDQLIAKVGSKLGIDRYGKSCNLSSGTCVIETDLNVKCVGSDPNKRACSAAYRVKTTSDSKVIMAPFGTSNPGAFVDSDFRTPIIFESYIQADMGQCPANQIMTGFNKYTGAVSCIPKVATTSCSAGEIFRGFKIVAGAVVPDCYIPSMFSCPYPYAVSTISYTGSGTVNGTCTFPTLDSGPMYKPWPGGTNTVHVACPTPYYTAVPVGSCTVSNVIKYKGHCVCDPMDATCDPNPNPSSPHAIGSLDSDGVTMRCHIVNGFGPCGAWSTGITSWNANCQLKSSYPSTL